MRLALPFVLLALVAGRAATASNAVPPGAAGSGAGAVSGYAVSDVSYTLDGEAVDAVSFALDPPTAATVKARLALSRPWTACTLGGGTVTCPVETPLGEASALAVVAAG